MKTYSQCKQDIFLREYVFKDKTDGYFIEIGANDGVTFSNTKIFEEMGWDGICIEPIPEVFNKLKENRTCRCVHGAISDRDTSTITFNHVVGASEMLSGIVDEYDPRHVSRIQKECQMFNCSQQLIEVPNYQFSDIVKIQNIDLLCIDTEGNELKILKTIDFNYYDIKIIVVENNYTDPEFNRIMEQHGYKLIQILEGDYVFSK